MIKISKSSFYILVTNTLMLTTLFLFPRIANIVNINTALYFILLSNWISFIIMINVFSIIYFIYKWIKLKFKDKNSRV